MARRDVLNNHPPHGYLRVALLFTLLSGGCSPRGGEGATEHEGSAVPPNAAPEASATPTAPISAGATTADLAGSGTPSQPAPSTVEASGNALPAAAPEKPEPDGPPALAELADGRRALDVDTTEMPPAGCIRPLKEFCELSYRQPMCNLIQQSIKQPDILKDRSFLPYDVGTCGRYRYTKWGDGYETHLSFFDDNDKLVAVQTQYDRIDETCKGKEYYGTPPLCRKISSKK